MMDLSKIKIATYAGQQIWMVRAAQGKYFQHFRFNNVVSIGHLDAFYDHRDDGSEIPSDEIIRNRVLRNPKYRDGKREGAKFNGSGTSVFNQVRHFIRDVKKGDLVLTVNSSTLLIGVCMEDAPFFSSDDLAPTEEANVNVKVRLDHRLRRAVKWGPAVSRMSVLGGLRKSLLSRKTVINVSEHWREVFGLIYPFVHDGENLYYSTHIGVSGAINGKVVGRLFDNLSDVELIAKQIMDGGLDRVFAQHLVNEDFAFSDYIVNTKAQFMSPGDIYSWVKIPDADDMALAVKILAIVFLLNSGMAQANDVINQMAATGAPGPSPFSVESIVAERNAPREGTKNLDRMLAEMVSDSKEGLDKIEQDKKVSEIKTNLQLSIPQHNTQVLEVEAGLVAVGVKSDEK